MNYKGPKTGLSLGYYKTATEEGLTELEARRVGVGVQGRSLPMLFSRRVH